MRYGFDYNLRQIVSEWLFISKKNKKEQPYFVRDEEGIGVDEMFFAEGVGLEERTNDNRLFLSLVAQLGGAISKTVLDFRRFFSQIFADFLHAGSWMRNRR